MADMDVEWALGELQRFLDLTELYRVQGPGVLSALQRNRGSDADIVASAEVVERILLRVLPGWRIDVPSDRNTTVNRWYQHREAVQRAIALLERQDELRLKLGDDAPRLSAASLHPWVWEGARSLWMSGHHREAVGAAARQVNAETQNKVGRRDLAETDLFRQAFSTDAPSPGSPRLRLREDDGSKTFSSVQRGAMAFAEGCYGALRNPVAHEAEELGVDEALEWLAAFSVLARWVDAAELVTG